MRRTELVPCGESKTTTYLITRGKAVIVVDYEESTEGLTGAMESTGVVDFDNATYIARVYTPEVVGSAQLADKWYREDVKKLVLRGTFHKGELIEGDDEKISRILKRLKSSNLPKRVKDTIGLETLV